MKKPRMDGGAAVQGGGASTGILQDATPPRDRRTEPDFSEALQAAAAGDLEIQRRVNAGLCRLFWQPRARHRR